MYRHFSSKSELLDELLVDISRRLYEGGEQVVDRHGGAGSGPSATLRALIEFHIDMLVTKPDLISVQDRDLSSLSQEANHEVRSLQRRYVERWVDVLVEVGREAGGPALGRSRPAYVSTPCSGCSTPHPGYPTTRGPRCADCWHRWPPPRCSPRRTRERTPLTCAKRVFWSVRKILVRCV